MRTSKVRFGAYAVFTFTAVSGRDPNKETKRIFGHTRDNTRANAFKHCYWSALITSRYGTSDAKGFTDRHEQGSPGTWLEHFMDYFAPSGRSA